MLTEYAGHRLLALLHEMRTLPLGTNLYRIYYEFCRKAGLHKHRYRAGPVSDGALREALGGRFAGAADLLDHLRSRRTPFFFDWRRRADYARILNDRFADDRAECLRLADEVCAHRFRLMGCDVRFEGEIDWHRLLEKKEAWPRRHWSRINIRAPAAPGEVKTTWELNRHQFWLHLGRAYWYTGDPKYPAEWARQLRSWLEQNPVEIGVNWLSNLEHAIRVVQWTWALQFFLDSPAITGDLVWEVYRMLLAKGRHIRRDIGYSLRVMPTNHLLGDALGLVFMGFCFPEFREAEAWRRHGLKVLTGQLPRQVRPDGTSVESSISYHRFVLYFYLLADLLHRAVGGGSPPPLVRQRMEKMIEVLQAVTKPDGSVSLYGDNDNAKAIFLSNEGPLDYRPTLATGACLFGRADFKHVAGRRLSQEALWLLGPEALDAWDALESRPPAATLTHFPDGGLATWRSAWTPDADYLLLKCAPFTGHCEADLGHVDLSIGGKPVLVDAGTYTYNGPWEWRTYFRGTSAHNTVSVDGRSQALAHRSFRFLFHPDRMESGARLSDGIVVMDCRHRSYRFLGGIVHRRRVVIVPGRFMLVVDVLEGRGRHAFGQHWHFDPAVDVSVGEDGVARAVPRGGEGVWFIPLARVGLVADLVSGRENPIQGWTTRGFGTRLPAPCVTYRWRDEMPTAQATAIVRGKVAQDGPATFAWANVTDTERQKVTPEQALGLVLRLGGQRHLLLIRASRGAEGQSFWVEGEMFAPLQVVSTSEG